MQKILCFGTGIYVLLLYLISQYDPTNILLWFTSMSTSTIALHVLAVAALLFFGFKKEIEHTNLRRAIGSVGFAIMAVAALATFTQLLTLPLRPLDYMLAVTVGIALMTTGLTLPSLTPEGEWAKPPKKFTFAYPRQALRFGAAIINSAAMSKPVKTTPRIHTAV